MLTQVKIKNFKALADVSLPLSKLNILAGANGAGKSSIVQAVVLMKQFAMTMGRELPLRGDFISLGTAKDVLFEWASEDAITFGVTVDGKEEEFVFSACERNDFLPVCGWTEEMDALIKDESIRAFDKVPANEKVGLLKEFFYAEKSRLVRRALKDFQYLSSARIEPKVEYHASSKSVSLGDIGVRGEYTAHYLSQKQRMVVENKKIIPSPLDLDSSTLLEVINAWMAYIAPKIRVVPDWNPDMNTATLSYRFVAEQDMTSLYTPINVGFGITYALPVVLSIVKAKPGSILVIENPEAHLHPAAQSVLGRMCAIAAESGVQLIVETHSDHFVNGVRVAVKEGVVAKDNVSFFFVEHDSLGRAQIQQPKISETGRLDFWPEGFFDEWDNQLEKLL